MSNSNQGLSGWLALVKLIFTPANGITVGVCGAVMVPVGRENLRVDVQHAERLVFLTHAPADGGPGGSSTLGHDAGVDDARRQG